ncbi:MAG: FmdE family protein [Deltaproteobacteria bacterium]|jgi:formylmethanofuran dehydrogenase subunit E|nr:FmdE family protein [Deltaproteobacteria bacterium]
MTIAKPKDAKPDWRDYLDRALEYHGHLCSGQILGLRVVLKGLELLGLDPLQPQRDLALFIETNRCLADAAFVVTGVTLGRRRVAIYNFGKAAITFLDLNTQRAYRVAVSSAIHPSREVKDLVAFWSQYTDEEILVVQKVTVPLKPEDLPGRPLKRITCPKCGEEVLDGRDVVVEGVALCRSCAGQSYYQRL